MSKSSHGKSAAAKSIPNQKANRDPNPLYFLLEDRLFKNSHPPVEETILPGEIRSLARMYLERSGGLLVSSTMALGSAIVALRSNASLTNGSQELGLLEAVLRLSEKQQVPPKLIMRALADEAPSIIVSRKLS